MHQIKVHLYYLLLKSNDSFFFLLWSLLSRTRSTHPCSALEDGEDLQLGDGLVRGLWVGFGCWSEDGVDIGVDQRDQLGVHGCGCLTELAIYPVLVDITVGHFLY